MAPMDKINIPIAGDGDLFFQAGWQFNGFPCHHCVAHFLLLQRAL